MTILQLFKFTCACLYGSKMRCGRFSDKSEIFAIWSLLLYVEILHRLTKLKEKSEMNSVHETKEKTESPVKMCAQTCCNFAISLKPGFSKIHDFFFGLFNGFSTMTTHNDIRTYLMHPACFPGHAQMLQTASAAFGRFDLHLMWSELMLVIKIHWKWSLDINLRTHKKYLECILVAHCRTKICKHLFLFKGCYRAWN